MTLKKLSLPYRSSNLSENFGVASLTYICLIYSEKFRPSFKNADFVMFAISVFLTKKFNSAKNVLKYSKKS
jgi:hypothetical protein